MNSSKTTGMFRNFTTSRKGQYKYYFANIPRVSEIKTFKNDFCF